MQNVATLMMAAGISDLVMLVVQRSNLNPVGVNLWIYCFHLTLFGLLGIFMNWQQRSAARGLAIANGKNTINKRQRK